MDDTEFLLWFLLWGVVVLALIIFAPLALLWALNTLFALGIAYTFKTWLAALVLSFAVGSSGAGRSKS